jgi:hypothetical protein
MTVTGRVKARQYRRSTSTWTPADERAFQEDVAALRFERRCEIDALSRKLARQTGAIAAFRVRHRIIEPTREMVP